MPGGPSTPPLRALVHAWLVLDFFGEARRSGGDASTLTTTIFSQSFLSLGVSALLYPEVPPVPFAAATLCVSTLLVALGAFDTEQPTHRRAADRVLLSTSPVSRLQAVLARSVHASFATMLVTIGMALPPAILLACHESDPWKVPLYLALACACSGLAIGTLSVLLRAARVALGGHGAALVAGTGKALLLGFGVVFFALSMTSLRGDADGLPFGRFGAELLPPYHAAKLLHDPAGQSWRALPWVLVGLALLGAAVVIGDGESDRRRSVRRPGWLARLDLRLAGAPADAAIAAFTSTMLWRSPGIRARVLPLLGMPAAFAFLALRGNDERGSLLFTAMALQFPAIYLPFVIAMLQQSDHQGARWLFDSAPGLPLARIQRATWIALSTHLLLPVHALALLGLLATGMAPLRAVPLSLYSFALGSIAARAMIRVLPEVPFSNDAAHTDLDLGNLTAYGLLLAGAGALVVTGPSWLPAAAAAGAALALVALLRRGAAERRAA